ncbi:MAG: DUF4349 domain-containing protein, partial [Leucobacter sp.]
RIGWIQTPSTLLIPKSHFWEGLVSGWNALIGAGAGALVMLGILLPWLALTAVITVVIMVIVRYAARRRRARSVRVASQPNLQLQPESAGPVENSTHHTPDTPQQSS